MTFRNDPPDNSGDELPPWLRDEGSTPPPAPTPPSSPKPLKKLNAPPPAEDDDSLPPWLRAEEKAASDQQSWLSSGANLADSLDTELTYDDWAAVQAEMNREKSIEEEIPDLSSPVPDAPLETGPLGTGPLASAGELPDWFLGLEALDTQDAPDWFTGTGTGILEEEPPVELPPQMPHPEKRPDSIASFFASLQEVPVYDEPEAYNPFNPAESEGPASERAEDDDELPELDWIAAQPYEPAQIDDSFRGTEMDAFFQSLSGQTAAVVTGELRLPDDMIEPVQPADTEPVLSISVDPEPPAPPINDDIPDVDWFAAAGLESIKQTLNATADDEEPDFGMLFGAAEEEYEAPRYPSLPGFDDDVTPQAEVESASAEPDEGTLSWLSELENIVTSVTTPASDYHDEDIDVEEAFASFTQPDSDDVPQFNTGMLRDAGFEAPEPEPAAADSFDWDAAPTAEEAEHVPLMAETNDGAAVGWLNKIDDEALAAADNPIDEDEAPMPKGIDLLPPVEKPSYKFTGMLVATGLQEPEPEPEPAAETPGLVSEWGFPEDEVNAWDAMFQSDASGAPASEQTMFDAQFGGDDALREAWMTDSLVSRAELPSEPVAASENDDWNTSLSFDELAASAAIAPEAQTTADNDFYGVAAAEAEAAAESAEPDMSWLESIGAEDYSQQGEAVNSHPLEDSADEGLDTSHAFGGFALEEPSSPAAENAPSDGDIDWLIAMQSGGELSVETPEPPATSQQDLAAFESALFGGTQPVAADASLADNFEDDLFGLPTTGMLTGDVGLEQDAALEAESSGWMDDELFAGEPEEAPQDEPLTLDMAALDMEPFNVSELSTPPPHPEAIEGYEAEYAADLAELAIPDSGTSFADAGITDAGILSDNAPDFAWGIGMDASADPDGTPDYARDLLSGNDYEDLFAGLTPEDALASEAEAYAPQSEPEGLGIGESTLNFSEMADLEALMAAEEAAAEPADNAPIASATSAYSFASAEDAEPEFDFNAADMFAAEGGPDHLSDALDGLETAKDAQPSATDAYSFASAADAEPEFDFNAADMFAAEGGADHLSDALDSLGTPAQSLDAGQPEQEQFYASSEQEYPAPRVTDYAFALSDSEDDFIDDEAPISGMFAEEPNLLPDTGMLTGAADQLPQADAADDAYASFEFASSLDEAPATGLGMGMDPALDDALYTAATMPDDYTSGLESALEPGAPAQDNNPFGQPDQDFDWQSGLTFGDDAPLTDESLPGWVQANEDAYVIDEDALTPGDALPVGAVSGADELPPDDFFASFGMGAEAEPEPAVADAGEFYFSPDETALEYDESAPPGMDWAAIGAESDAYDGLSAFEAIAGAAGTSQEMPPVPNPDAWLEAYQAELPAEDQFVLPAAETPAEEPVYGDLDSYLKTLSIQTGELKPITRTLLEPDADLEAMLEAKATEDDASPQDYNPFSGAKAFTAIDAEMAELADADTPDWLSDVSVGEVSATAIVRQRKDRDVSALDDRLRKLRQRGENLPTEAVPASTDSLSSVLPGVEDTLAPAVIKATTGVGTGGIALTDEQQKRVALLRSLVSTVTDTAVGSGAEPRESAIDETFDDTYFPDFGEDQLIQPVGAKAKAGASEKDQAKAARRAKNARARARRARRIRSRLERAVLAAVLLGAAALPFVVREARVGDLPPVAFDAGSAGQAAWSLVENLRPGSVVLVGIEYSAGSAGELDSAADAALRHVLMRGAYPVVVSTNPIALLRAETLLSTIAADEAFLERLGVSALESNRDYFLVQNIPGGAIGLRAFSENTASVLVNDLRGQVTGLTLTTLRDFSAIIVVSDSMEEIRAWAEQIATAAQAPAIAFVSYSAAPLAEPYIGVNNALDGLVVGYAGAYTYNTLIGNLPSTTVVASEATEEVTDESGTPAATHTPTSTIAAQIAPRETDRPAPLLFTPTATFTPTNTPTHTPTATFTPSNTFTPTFTPTPVVGVVQSSQAVNLRSEPSVASSVITQLAPGTQVTIIGISDDTEWYNVQLASGTTGWINRSLLTIPQAGAYSPSSLLMKPAAQETARPPIDFAATATAMSGGGSQAQSASGTPTPRPPTATRAIAVDDGDDTGVEIRPSATRTPRPTSEVVEPTSTRTTRASATAQATATRTPRPTNTSRPTAEVTPEATPEITPEATPEAVAVIVPPPPPSPGLRDERWFSITAGIIASSAIIGAGALLNIGRSIARRRRAR